MSGLHRRAPRVAVLLLGAWLFVDPPGVIGHGAPSIGVYVTTEVADVKKGPGQQYPTVRTLPKGKAFDVVGRQGRWLMVRLSEHETAPGYLDERYAVERKPEDLQRKMPIPSRYLTMTAIEARGGPGEQYPVVSKIPKGSRVTVVAIEANWLRITSKHGDPPRYVLRSQARLQSTD
jgi:hypothetical protein